MTYAAKLRVFLEGQRKQGIPFDMAWVAAVKQLPPPDRDWGAVNPRSKSNDSPLMFARAMFRKAYQRQALPGRGLPGPDLAGLHEMLQDPEGYANLRTQLSDAA